MNFVRPWTFSLLILFLEVGCYDSTRNADEQKQSQFEKRDTGTIDLTDAADGVDPRSTLDSLSTDKSRDVCVAAMRKTDFCMSRAYQENTVEACRQYVEICRSKNIDLDLYASCKTMDYGEPGSCAVTRSEYLGCIEAFEQLRNCENVGKDLVAPEPCRKVIDQCALLADEFGREPEQVPKCSIASGPEGDPRDDKDIYGAQGCFPTPSRFVVLGDSISKCVSFSEKIEDCNCSWKNIAGYIRDNYAPELTIEGCYPYDEIRGNIADVANDIQTIARGTGHIAVWISAIAWDLMDVDEVESAVPRWLEQWQRVFDYFGDRSRFPDGATFMLNTIYNPTDACPDSEKNTAFTNLSTDEDHNIRYAIENVLIYLAQERDDTITVDIYPDWLGHGYNFDVTTCPYYSPEKEYWMSDLLHPNNTGYLHIAEKWKRAIDRIYGNDC